ncbi:MAG: hypothetical protein FWH26_05870 [Oscillospiraceae bacterium]|nr:hypothetical protein [Oscillospiraceae bacterium]
MEPKNFRKSFAEPGVQLFGGLSACALVCGASILLSILVHGVPVLRDLSGALPKADGVFVVDPNKKDETMLDSGSLYDRPMAVAQTGAETVLLRARLEETMLTLRRDENGAVVVPMPSREPEENLVPRLISQPELRGLLTDGGFCSDRDDWDAMMEKRLPAKRLPGGKDDDGRILVFEKVNTVKGRSDIPMPDLSALLPDDVEALGLSRTTYSYLGFYLLSETEGEARYQPLQLTVNESAEPPKIEKILYQFFQWDVAERSIRQFGGEPHGPVRLQAGELYPLKDWTEPAAAWFYDEDGWIYYGDTLGPGDMTPLLIESFTVEPGSPLLRDETRYRIHLRTQSATMDQKAVLSAWNAPAQLDGLGNNAISDDAANFAAALLGLWDLPP